MKSRLTPAGIIALITLNGAAFASGQTPAALPSKPAAKTTTPPKFKVTPKNAETTVLKKFPGKIVGKTVLENEDGKWQYAVNVRSGKTLREVMVNAATGKIGDSEITTDAEEAKEAKADALKAKAASKTAEKDDEKNEKPEKGGK